MTTLLIVDDDEYIRSSLERLLGSRYTIHTAASGIEALDLLQSTRIDAAIVDLVMPGMDGETLIEELRGRGHGFPILVVSAMGGLERVAARCRPSDFVLKPAFPEVLREKLDALLA